MNFDQAKSALSRKPIWMVKIYLDQCTRTFGVSPCLATGTPCYYSYTTCKHRVAYNRTTDVYWNFLSRDSLLMGALSDGKLYLPYLAKITFVSQEIDPKRNLSRRGELQVELSDDLPLKKSVPNKTVQNDEVGGSFWRNLLARNPNYQRRIVEIYLGFQGIPASEFRLYFKGRINTIEYKNWAIIVSVKDMLNELTKETPKKAHEGTKVQVDYTGGAALKCYYGQHLPDWGIIKSEGGKYVYFNGKTGPDANGIWTLTNCNYTFGSSGTISAEKKIAQVLVYARNQSGIAEGLSVDMILLDLMLTRAKLNYSDLHYLDSGATLTADITANATSIPVSNALLFPDQGIIRIDNELICYKGKSGSNLVLSGTGAGNEIPLFKNHLRGFGRTTAAAHSSAALIYLPKITTECLSWLQGMRFRAELAEPKKIQDRVNELCDQAMVQCWQNEDGKATFAAIAPPLPSLSVADLKETDHLLDKTIFYKDDLEQQATRVVVYIKPTDADAGDDPKNYTAADVEIEEDIENENYLGDEKQKIFFGNWIYQASEAFSLASRYLIRYKEGARLLEFKLDLKDWDLQLGELFWLDTGILLDSDGLRHQRLLCQAIKKQLEGAGRIKINAIETKLTRRYAFIGPFNPTLYASIDEDDTTIVLQLVDDGDPLVDTYQNEDFADAGMIRLADEKIKYISKSYNATTKQLTLTCTGGRGALGTTPATHTAGDDALLLYYGAGDDARNNYAWIGGPRDQLNPVGPANPDLNLLDSDGDGIGDQEGYYIY